MSLCVLIDLHKYNRILTIIEIKSSQMSLDLKYCAYETE